MHVISVFSFQLVFNSFLILYRHIIISGKSRSGVNFGVGIPPNFFSGLRLSHCCTLVGRDRRRLLCEYPASQLVTLVGRVMRYSQVGDVAGSRLFPPLLLVCWLGLPSISFPVYKLLILDSFWKDIFECKTHKWRILTCQGWNSLLGHLRCLCSFCRHGTEPVLLVRQLEGSGFPPSPNWH